MNKTEVTRAKIDKWGKIVIAGLVCLAVSPIIFAVVKGALGLLIAFIVGATTLTFTPWFTMKLANWKVKAIVAEAKANPIETLTNLVIDSKKAFDIAKVETTNAVSARDVAFRKIDNLAKKYPARAAEFSDKKAQLATKVEKKKVALDNMHDRIVKAEETLEEMKAYWDVAQAFHAADKAVGNSTDVYDKLKADTAYDSVYESLSSAFAEMEVASAITIDQIENDPSPVFQGTTIDVQSKVAR